MEVTQKGNGVKAAVAPPRSKAHPAPPPSATQSQEFVCRTMCENQLPDLPVDPKFVRLAPGAPLTAVVTTSKDEKPAVGLTAAMMKRFTEWCPSSSLIRAQRLPILAEWDLGILLTPVDAEAYRCPPTLEKLGLHPDDKTIVTAACELTGRGVKGGAGHGAHKHLARPNKEAVSWLRKPEYLTNDVYSRVHNFKSIQQSVERGGNKRAIAIARLREGNPAEMTVESRAAEAIESFNMAQVPTHPFGKDVTPVCVIPVFPNTALWGSSYSRVTFDSPPALLPTIKGLPVSCHSKAILKAYASEGEQFLGYMVLDDGGDAAVDGEYNKEMPYRWVTEYLFSVDRRDLQGVMLSLPPSFVRGEAALDDDCAAYVPLSRTIALERMLKYRLSRSRPSKVSAKRQRLNRDERQQRALKRRELLPDGGEWGVDDQDQVDDDDDDGQGDIDNDDKNNTTTNIDDSNAKRGVDDEPNAEVQHSATPPPVAQDSSEGEGEAQIPDALSAAGGDGDDDAMGDQHDAIPPAHPEMEV